MNQTENEARGNDGQGTDEIQTQSPATLHQPSNGVALAELGKTVSPDNPTGKPHQGRYDKYRAGCRAFYEWLCELTPGDVIGAIVACIGIWLIIRQNALIASSNAISQSSAVSAKAAADASIESLRMAKDGEATAQKTAEAIQKTAEANAAAAEAAEKNTSAMGELATSNAKAVELSRQANETANRSAAAAENAAKEAKESSDLTREGNETSGRSLAMLALGYKLDLRSYITISGVQLRYQGDIAQATLQFTNNGKTFAHRLVLAGSMACLPAGEKPVFEMKTMTIQRSIGPGGQFEHRFEKRKSQDFDEPWSEMRCWIVGTVHYTDDFGDDRFTSFNFVQRTPSDQNGNARLEYAAVGNNSDQLQIPDSLRSLIDRPAENPIYGPIPQ